MKTKQMTYSEMWNVLKQGISAKMDELANILQREVPFIVTSPYLSGPDESFGYDIYRSTILIDNHNGITVAAIDFNLFDGYGMGWEGYGVACKITGFNSLSLSFGGYSPCNGTESFLTNDKDELEGRISAMDVAEFYLAVRAALNSPLLLQEVAKAA